MVHVRKITIFIMVLLMIVNAMPHAAFADHNEHEEKNRHQNQIKERKHSEHNDNENLTIVNNPQYKENCGACHFTYQPELLPSASWSKILTGLADHFGETIELDPESATVILSYLKSNAAEFSTAKPAVKIMKSIGNQTPQRITGIPYIQKKHHEISQNILNRASIGSLSNCSACHTTAEKGIYDDDNVQIPNETAVEKVKTKPNVKKETKK
jgi:hypothetical protein